MTIFVPPPVFGEMKTVFDSPVISYVSENVVSCDLIWVKTGDEVARITQHNAAIVSG